MALLHSPGARSVGSRLRLLPSFSCRRYFRLQDFDFGDAEMALGCVTNLPIVGPIFFLCGGSTASVTFPRIHGDRFEFMLLSEVRFVHLYCWCALFVYTAASLVGLLGASHSFLPIRVRYRGSAVQPLRVLSQQVARLS